MVRTGAGLDLQNDGITIPGVRRLLVKLAGGEMAGQEDRVGPA